ncbi:MAG: hypothetical protein HQM10_21945 [Candidatus Riflebacteria bacterium]|nr:hypothetical protein [Candidatus Riflebacteria bacterium]
MKKMIFQSKSGFTFFEIIAGLALLITIFVPILFFSVQIKQSTEINREEILGNSAACELLEQFSSIPFSDIASGTIANDRLINGAQIATSSPWKFIISEPDMFSRILTITEQTGDGKVIFKKLEAEVSWLSESGATRTVKLSNLIANENP